MDLLNQFNKFYHRAPIVRKIIYVCGMCWLAEHRKQNTETFIRKIIL